MVFAPNRSYEHRGLPRRCLQRQPPSDIEADSGRARYPIRDAARRSENRPLDSGAPLAFRNNVRNGRSVQCAAGMCLVNRRQAAGCAPAVDGTGRALAGMRGDCNSGPASWRNNVKEHPPQFRACLRGFGMGFETP